MPVGRFDAPVFAATPPGIANTLYVVEQAGRIVVWQHGKVRARPFSDVGQNDSEEIDYLVRGTATHP